jgi:hypothetical protein
MSETLMLMSETLMQKEIGSKLPWTLVITTTASIVCKGTAIIFLLWLPVFLKPMFLRPMFLHPMFLHRNRPDRGQIISAGRMLSG